MGKNESKQQNTASTNNENNLVNVNAPGGLSIQVLGMDIQVSDLRITIGPDANVGEIHSLLDQIRRRA